MPTQTQLPIYLESFSKLRKEGFSYIDKTGLIRELLEHRSTVNLLAFSEGFGKSLALDMLKPFLEFGSSKSEFEGLKIARKTALCQQYMGKFR